ncbi:hypothetical protein ACLOJK_015640 [Asimina triloba]
MGKRKALGCSNIEQEDADVDATNSPSKRVREELIVDPCDVPTDKPAMCPSSEEKEKTGSSGKRKRDDQGMHPGIDASAFDGEGGSKRTRIKWASDDAQFKMLGPIQLPDFVKEPIVGANLAIEIQRLNMHLAVINRKLQESGVPDDFLGEDRSVYLPPDVDFLGNRINSRQAMHHEKLIWQRQRIISRLILMNPTFKPPPACKPEKLYKKLYIPLKEYPECNFTGLIIGPRGSTLKRMERETGARIRVKGKGLLKEGRAHCKDPMENEDLHVLIEAENNKSLDAAVEMVEKLLVPCNEGINDHKVAQLKELAELNIMCRVCGGLGHKQNMCPCRSSVARGTDYPDTASVMGSKMEQRHSFLGGRPPFVDASSVPIHASWAYHPASGASPFYMPYSGSTTAMKNKIDKENNESNLYVGYLPRTVDDGRLIQLFSPFGRLISAKVVRDKKTGLSKGIGFVKFVNPVDAARAVARMNGHKIDGRILVVRVAGRLHGASLNYRTSVSTGIDHRIMDMRPKYMHLNNPKQLERPAATESVQPGPHASTTKSCNFESACSPVHTAQTGSFCSQLPLSCGSSAQFQISPCCMNERASPNWPNNVQHLAVHQMPHSQAGVLLPGQGNEKSLNPPTVSIVFEFEVSEAEEFCSLSAQLKYQKLKNFVHSQR